MALAGSCDPRMTQASVCVAQGTSLWRLLSHLVFWTVVTVAVKQLQGSGSVNPETPQSLAFDENVPCFSKSRALQGVVTLHFRSSEEAGVPESSAGGTQKREKKKKEKNSTASAWERLREQGYILHRLSESAFRQEFYSHFLPDCRCFVRSS